MRTPSQKASCTVFDILRSTVLYDSKSEIRYYLAGMQQSTCMLQKYKDLTCILNLIFLLVDTEQHIHTFSIASLNLIILTSPDTAVRVGIQIMTTLSGGIRLAFLIFFASHIFVTLFMTAQTVVPWIYPGSTQTS